MIFDGIIVGGGHSGVEAAVSMSKMGKKVALITGNLDKVSSLPCNPSIGGSAKGIVVREIDALGGIMGIAADYNQIQIKMLNSSKGPAVRALRAQIDKLEYPKYILKLLKSTNNLTLIEDLVDKLIVENGSVEGIITKRGNKFKSKTVILTTGTYLSSKILMGKKKTTSGPIGEPTTFGLSKQLKELGFELIRLKTGTPPRIIKDSINFEILEKQFGDDIKYTFSFLNKYNNKAQEPCYLTHTTPKTKEIILKNIFESPMYSGKINSTGPRYCPSIEDKVVRFENKDIHQVFIEPESLSLNEMYIQGLSTSFPEKIQEKNCSFYTWSRKFSHIKVCLCNRIRCN
jgi:tRNA uridine 5-carboxymethylaminomethyl modification enzyme